jgi:hypothetical protein
LPKAFIAVKACVIVNDEMKECQDEWEKWWVEKAAALWLPVDHDADYSAAAQFYRSLMGALTKQLKSIRYNRRKSSIPFYDV